ncbi:MAG: hypothetical protein WD058_08650 [Dehalococcoidia bacterium]
MSVMQPEHQPETDARPPLQTKHIRAAGFGAAVDACVTERSEIWFLSLLGNQQSIRALWARLVKGEMAYLADDQFAGGAAFWLATSVRHQCRFHVTRLSATGAHHALLVPDAALYAAEQPEFLLLARTAEEAPVLHYRFLNRRLDLPLHPTWSGWLWERALHTGEAQQLDAMGILAYRCTPDPAGLAEALGRALRGHRLPVPPDTLTEVS